MTAGTDKVLTINAGSSSIKFALFEGSPPCAILDGNFSSISGTKSKIEIHDATSGTTKVLNQPTRDFDDAIRVFMVFLSENQTMSELTFISHRIVQGREYAGPVLINETILAEFKSLSPVDPEHMPVEIKLIEACRSQFPQVRQIACFDTAWFKDLPQLATIIPIPRKFRQEGVRRYGFHGLSYAYVQEKHARLDPQASQGRIIMAHLGSGASIAAVRNGLPVECSMGFSPSSGITMGTRTGDLDPAVAWYLLEIKKMSPTAFNKMVTHESGLLGISETTSSMKDLMASRDVDPRAEEAVQFFCYQVRKWIGSFTAVLGGLDTLIFTGGIGENNATIRAMICAGLEFLGIELDEANNDLQKSVISSPKSTVSVRVISTNEEMMLARAAGPFMKIE